MSWASITTLAKSCSFTAGAGLWMHIVSYKSICNYFSHKIVFTVRVISKIRTQKPRYRSVLLIHFYVATKSRSATANCEPRLLWSTVLPGSVHSHSLFSLIRTSKSEYTTQFYCVNMLYVFSCHDSLVFPLGLAIKVVAARYYEAITTLYFRNALPSKNFWGLFWTRFRL